MKIGAPKNIKMKINSKYCCVMLIKRDSLFRLTARAARTPRCEALFQKGKTNLIILIDEHRRKKCTPYIDD